ncbi:cytochrome c biogenesis protein DipZ [Candidatus Woesebacteria bacterium]|nr:cytochrome c biogenesis protein DipZ [Candidatus Woesebacteria bacterium]
MLILLLFAFVAGVVTVLSPCILPLLPVILSSSDGSGKQRPTGVIVGFIASFTFFTLFLSTIVQLSGIPSSALRSLSVVILALFGISLLIPKVQALIEQLFSRFANLMPSGQKRQGFWGGIVIGLSLGLLWTPCVGPILASVISLAITGTVTAQSFLITLSYAVGTAIPLFLIMLAGSTALQRVPWLVRNTSLIQKLFGVLMIMTAAAILFNVDRSFQTFILNTFPQYGAGLTKIEDNQQVQNALQTTTQQKKETDMKPTVLNTLALPKGPAAPDLVPGGEWFNSEPLTLADLKGKVVLVDFWTYSCINCQRTLPYLKTWWEKYHDKGLVIIGVHSPEFEFEKDPKNVAKALADFGITYPVVQDNDFATWKAYRNQYWPAKYLVDAEGFIRYSHFGEGQYDKTEETIQTLLEEAGMSAGSEPIDNPSYSTSARTPETYLGYARIENLVSREQIKQDALQTFTAPARIPDSQFAYVGDWMLTSEYAAPAPNAELLMQFDAKEVYLVARPKTTSGTIQVFLDGQASSLGDDVEDGVVAVDSDRLYKLIKLPSAGKHQLRLVFPEDSVELYAFTFG